MVDKRQELHFVQVFRCARKTGLVKPETELKFLGFGTMNGKDGKPFKTRDGGVMRLEYLVSEIDNEMLKKITENQKAKRILESARKKQRKLQKQLHLPQSNMEIFLIRQVKTIFLISTDLLLLREIQDHTFCIRSFVSSRFFTNIMI